MKTHMMKAIVATGYGKPDVLELTEVAIPEPQENEVLVRVFAASATRADGMLRAGTPWYARLFMGLRKPKQPIPGTGFAGVLENVGTSVQAFKVGERVFGESTMKFSTNAEYVTIPANGVVLSMPDSMTFGEAATFCDGHLTSMNFLREIAALQPGQQVLINGASGALGTAAVQLAKHFGANVTGVCSTANIGLVKSLGADRVIDYTKADFTRGQERYDVIYDAVGKSTWSKCRRVLNDAGQYLSPVLRISLLFQMLWTAVFSTKKAKFAATGLLPAYELRALLEDLKELFLDGKLTTVIDRQYPLEKVADAHAYIATGRKKGNVVINVNY